MSAHVARDPETRESYAGDASGLRAVPEGVARPGSTDELREVLAAARAAGECVTPAGGQTATTGAAIAQRGLLLSLRAMDRVLDVDPVARTARVEPGVLLGALNHQLAAEGLFFAPDPTSENECTVGGAIACNASGPRTYRYGATRAHVRAVTVALADGRMLELRRPALEKNTVGYQPLHDLVDWFVGSEGTLGVVTAAELALLPRPAVEIGLAIPFLTTGGALQFIIAARESDAVRPRCLEYFDGEALGLARAAIGEPAWAAAAGAMVYVEEVGERAIELDGWLELATRFDAVEDDIKAFDSDAAFRQARHLRHAVPAGMHERTAPFKPHGGRRVSTDWAVPYRRVAEALARSRTHCEAAGVAPGVTYGHVGNGHPHQNWVGRDPEHVRRIEGAVEATLRDVIAMGGTVAAEHGIGKIKARWAPLQLSGAQLGLMRAVKHELDPTGMFAPGNLLA